MTLFTHISMECLKELAHAVGIHAMAFGLEKALHLNEAVALLCAAVLRVTAPRLFSRVLRIYRRKG